jgi:hypothetical protein
VGRRHRRAYGHVFEQGEVAYNRTAAFVSMTDWIPKSVLLLRHYRAADLVADFHADPLRRAETAGEVDAAG